MKRTLLTGIVAFVLIGASFGQAAKQGNQGKTQNPQDPTAFQKGHADPSDQTDPIKKQKQKNKKKTDPTKTGKQNKSPIDPNPTGSTSPKGNGPTVPAPTPAPTK